MKAINVEKFICSMLQYAENNCEETMLDYLRSALQDQDLEYKDGEIVEIEQEQPYNKPLFFEKGKWYTCIAKVDGFKVGHAYQSKMDGTVSNDSGAMYMYHNDANFIFRPAIEEEIPHEPPSKPDYENLSIINEGDDGMLLYFTKDGRGISDFRISKDTARWLHGRLGEYLEMYDDEQPIEPEEKAEHWQRMHDVAMERIKEEFKEEDSLETKAIKEQIENLKKRIEDNQLGCIVQRLDKIIELLQSAILILPKETRQPFVTSPVLYGCPTDILYNSETTSNKIEE